MDRPLPAPSPLRLTLSERWRDGRARLEEVANALTHGLGAAAALVLSPFLILAAPEGVGRLSVTIYSATMIMLFGSSTLFHALEETRFAERWSSKLQILDHVAIYHFIAGSYTPFLIISLASPI